MTTLGDVATVRSKNAGPFVLTIDVFCPTVATYARIRSTLTAERVAGLLACDVATLAVFPLADLHVLKFSLPRPTVQGSPDDRAMHGAQFAALLAELPLPATRDPAHRES